MNLRGQRSNTRRGCIIFGDPPCKAQFEPLESLLELGQLLQELVHLQNARSALRALWWCRKLDDGRLRDPVSVVGLEHGVWRARMGEDALCLR